MALKSKFKELVNLSISKNYYSDFNYFKTLDVRISLDKENISINEDEDSGIKVRIWDNEKFLDYGQTNLNFEDLENNFNKLLEVAEENQNKIKTILNLKLDKSEINKQFKSKMDDKMYSLKEKIELLTKYKNAILNFSKEIINVRVVLIDKKENHIFVNQYKNLEQEIQIKIFALISYIKCEDGNIRELYEIKTGNTYDEVFSKIEDNFQKYKTRIKNLRFAKKLEGGKYKVILSPSLSGLLAHESFGHGMEADTIMKNRALVSQYLNKKIGNDKINIVDYPSIPGKNGEFYFDHEGNIAKKVYLLKNGVINEPMADLYSKSRLNLNNSSNGRFESFDHKIYARMSNTYFEGGNDLLEEMISSIDDGILIISSSGGMEDPKGWGVQIQGNFGQRIKNGKLTDEFYDGFTLTGFLPDIIKNISKISQNVEIDGAGSCGKGHIEWVRVAEGGPYLLINEVILG